jgi:DNA-binding transcriptional ArsR family regulator
MFRPNEMHFGPMWWFWPVIGNLADSLDRTKNPGPNMGKKNHIPDPLEPQRCAELLCALASPERLRIVRFLTDGEKNVSEIIEALGIPPLNVSHHLNALKQAQLIQPRKEGRFVYYSLCQGVLGEAVSAGIPHEALNLGCCELVLPSQPGSSTNC